MKSIKIFVIVFFLLVGLVNLQADASIKFKVLVQSWFSYGQQDIDGIDSGYGFTLRRVRFIPYGNLTKNITWTVHFAYDKQNPIILDAFMNFKLSPGFQFKVGQFAAPGAISGALTSSAALDLVERSPISQLWGGYSGLYGYRAFGAQVHGDLAGGKIYYAFMLANPKTTTLFTPTIKSPGYSHDKSGIMFWGRLEGKFIKGLRLGVFYGGGEETETEYVRNSYGGFLIYKNNAFRVKTEYIAGEYGPSGIETKYSGLYGQATYKFGKFEPALRYGVFQPNDGDADSNGVEQYSDITLGINYYYNKSVKFQVNYVIRSESMVGSLDELKNDLFYINFQYLFK